LKSDLHDGIDGTEIVLTLKLEIARAILKREEGLSLKRVSNIFLIIIIKKWDFSIIVAKNTENAQA